MLALPLSWPLSDRRVILIGQDPLLSRKIALLEKTPARLEIYAPYSAQDGAEPRWPTLIDLYGASLVIVAFDGDADAERGAALARGANLPLNVVDRPDLSDFHIPAIVDRGAVSIGIGTSGLAPVLARKAREAIEAALPPSFAHVAELAKRLSAPLRAKFSDVATRRRAWEEILSGPVAERARTGDVDGAERDALLQDAPKPAGKVFLVGAGPGDPELLTLKALRVLSEADVIVHDRLVDPRILDLARRDADRIFVGKARAAHAVPQDEINQILIREAKQGKRVVRLKGGDVFIFGRGGEELAALKAEQIDTEVVPGITAALGCGASLGVPLTHRDHSQSLTLVTGHACGGKDGQGTPDPELDYVALSRPNQTLVIYMGTVRAENITRRLLAAGRAETTPVLIVENGTRPDQRAVRTTLSHLPPALDAFVGETARGAKPTLLIIGEVAALAETAPWLIPAALSLGEAA